MGVTLKNTLAHLRASIDHLTESEQRLVRAILAAPEKVVNESIHELAERSRVSESTVFRACKRLGYAGFPQFKVALAIDLADSDDTKDDESQFSGAVQIGDSLHDIVHKVFTANIRALQHTLAQCDLDQLQRAVDTVINARLVGVFASGTQGHLVDHCISKLEVTGIHCVGRVDTLQQLSLVTAMQPTDALLVFNHSGRLRHLVEGVKLARARGVTTIAFTNFAQSPLAQNVDICVTTYGEGAMFFSESMTSAAAQMVMVDCLLAEIASQRGEVVMKNFQSKHAEIERLRV